MAGPAELPDLAPDVASLAGVNQAAPRQFMEDLASKAVTIEERRHEPARHARHLASLWEASLSETARATLLYADGEALLAVVPADRKIGAPRLRAAVERGDLRVLRADRGAGRIGWRGLAPPAGPLPAVPGLFLARAVVDALVLVPARLIISLTPDHSLALAPADYIRVTRAAVLRFAGSTRLLATGGIVEDDPYPELTHGQKRTPPLS